jgi:ectoine hydroxylase-related dioxygenase (phytanoyl-CoA dioxygenase family)
MIADLSEVHSQVSGLFSRPDRHTNWDRYRLSQEQVDFFHENGYCSGVGMLTEEQVARFRAELADLIDPAYPGNQLFHEYHSNESQNPDTVLFHALGAWRIKPAFHDVLWNPAFVMPASQLLNGSVRFWHDQLFCKPAWHGGVVAWHQDYSYWTRTQPMEHLTCWIALDDSTRDNGCLQYVPRSHRWPLLPTTGLTGNMDEIQSVLTEEQRQQFRPVAIELKAGEASFHHPLMVHGSYENRTDRPRRATVINIFRDGVRSASDGELLQGVPAIPSGRKMEGQFFPLLFDQTMG